MECSLHKSNEPQLEGLLFSGPLLSGWSRNEAPIKEPIIWEELLFRVLRCMNCIVRAASM